MRERRQVRSQFTSLSYVNAHDEALLLAGSDDGFLRVYKDRQKDTEEAIISPNSNAKVKLVTAWNALREMVPMAAIRTQQHFGLCVAWEQKSRMIAAGGGDCRVIRLWDANRELKVADLAVGGDGDGFVSCLSFSNQTRDLLTAGFSDGFVRVFDVRVGGGLLQRGSSSSLASSAVLHHREHTGAAVLDCQLQDAGGFAGHVVSGAADGSIKVADPRRLSGAPMVKSLSLGQAVTALSLHQRAFAVAARTQQHGAVVHTLLGSGAQLGAVRTPSEGVFGSHRGAAGGKGPHGCVAFHPHLIQLATAPPSGNVGVYSLRNV